MSKLEAKHEGFGRWNVLNESGEKQNTEPLTKEAAEEMATTSSEPTPDRPNRNKGRRERRTFGKARSRLTLDDKTKRSLKEQGLVERWVNDDGNRIKDKYDCGYEFVSATGKEIIGDADGSYEPPSEASHMRQWVGTRKDGTSMYAYLMVTTKENYEEDTAAKEAINMKVDEGIRGGKPSGAGNPGLPNSSQGTVSVKNVEYNP
jgi:hypothetical protein